MPRPRQAPPPAEDVSCRHPDADIPGVQTPTRYPRFLTDRSQTDLLPLDKFSLVAVEADQLREADVTAWFLNFSTPSAPSLAVEHGQSAVQVIDPRCSDRLLVVAPEEMK